MREMQEYLKSGREGQAERRGRKRDWICWQRSYTDGPSLPSGIIMVDRDPLSILRVESNLCASKTLNSKQVGLEGIKTRVRESTQEAKPDQIILTYSAIFMGTTGDTLSFLICTLSVRMGSSHWLQFYINTKEPQINAL